MGQWLCVPLLTAACGEPHPTVSLFEYPPLSWANTEGFPTWALVHVHTPRGGCAWLVPGGIWKGGEVWVGTPAWVGGSTVWDPPSYNSGLGGWICGLAPPL